MQIIISKDELYNRGSFVDQLMDTAFDSSILTDADLRIIRASKTSAMMTGHLSPDDKIGLHIINENVPTILEFEEVLRTGKMKRNYVSNILGKRTISTVIPIKDIDDPNTVIGVLGCITFRGLSDFKQLAEALTEAENEKSKDLKDKVSRYVGSYSFSDFIGCCTVINKVREECRIAAKSTFPVLLVGETGTGKEILANSIHFENFNTKNGPFIKLNCTAIPHDLFESEIFGHAKGSFTGAINDKKGKFELANGGSILLDEIGDMPLNLQSKFLRVLEEKEFERVGDTKMIPFNARVIASTNKDLPKLINRGEFRADLYFRLNTLEISIPPLRNHPEDIELLIKHICTMNFYNFVLLKEALDALKDYNWPGNVRQLKSLLQRFSVIKYNQVVNADDVLSALEYSKKIYTSKEESELQIDNDRNRSKSKSLSDNEKENIISILKESNMSLKNAAENLGVSRKTLYNKIKKYNILIEHNIKY